MYRQRNVAYLKCPGNLPPIDIQKGPRIMIGSPRSIAFAAVAIVALHSAPAAATDKAKFVFTALVPPNSFGEPFVTGAYQNQAVGYYTPKGTDSEEGFVWSAGNYTSIPGLSIINALSDSGVVIGTTPGSTTSYTTYDVTSGATNVFDFGPPAVMAS
jgi:hypothetical protein